MTAANKRSAPVPAIDPSTIEWEVDSSLQRTGRWRRRQFYAKPGGGRDERLLSERTPCEWRTGKPR